jgi:ATP-dependent RNA helicase DDX56/DBP9
MSVDEKVLSSVTFESLGLDDRLLKGLKRGGWARPTLIQEAAIPLALQGKDILARAKTGSGKTAAYALPVIQKILERASAKRSSGSGGLEAIVLVPTKDLCAQVAETFRSLAHYAARLISVCALAGDGSLDEQRIRLAENPSVVIATPGRLAQHLRAGHLPDGGELGETLHSLVVDEADLVLTFGYEDDVRALLAYLPSAVQSYLMSATLSPELERFKRVVLHNAAVLRLDDAASADGRGGNTLAEYALQCIGEDKFLIVYALLQLKLIVGKTLFFVNSVDRAFRLKLFLERFSIRAAVLNSELPVNSRQHILQEFNRGIYKILIATDEDLIDHDRQQESSDSDESSSSDDDDDDDDEKGKKSKSKKKKKKKKKKKTNQKSSDASAHDYGVARGFDFMDVKNVINFDFPASANAYVHRVGRTARAGKQGSALSLVTSRDRMRYSSVCRQREQANAQIRQYQFHMPAIEAFRYRVSDVLRSVSAKHVREARVTELKSELINSEKLRVHFEENPDDLKLLEHDRPLIQAAVRPHLKHVPSYLLDAVEKSARDAASRAIDAEHASKKRKKRKPAATASSAATRAADPLRTFRISNNRRKNADRKRRSCNHFQGIRGDDDVPISKRARK